VPACEQFLDDVSADEARRARDKNLRHLCSLVD
jgi:hypothetical protein